MGLDSYSTLLYSCGMQRSVFSYYTFNEHKIDWTKGFLSWTWLSGNFGFGCLGVDWCNTSIV